MTCPEEYNLSTDFDYGEELLCLTNEGLGMGENAPCDLTAPMRFAKGRVMKIHNLDAVEHTITIKNSAGEVEAVATIGPDITETVASLPAGIHTFTSSALPGYERKITYYFPGAMDLQAKEAGCCRASILLRCNLLYMAFQDFNGTLYPQYLRYREQIDLAAVTSTYAVYGPGHVPGNEPSPPGTVIGPCSIITTNRWRQPQRDRRVDGVGVTGRQEVKYEPDSKLHLWYYGQEEIVIGPGGGGVFGGGRHEENRDNEAEREEYFYWLVFGEEVQVSATRMETPITWRGVKTLDGVIDGEIFEGGSAGIMFREYELPYTASAFAAYLEYLMDDDNFDLIDYPYTRGTVDYAYQLPCPDEGAETIDFDAGTVWPIDHDLDYSAPGPNQPDERNHYTLAYRCILDDNGSSYSGLINDNQPPVEDPFAMSDLDKEIYDYSAQEWAPLKWTSYIAADAIELPTLTSGFARQGFDVFYARVKRRWSAPFCKQLIEVFEDNNVVDPEPMATEIIECEENLTGDPAVVSPCAAIEDAGESHLETLAETLERYFTDLNLNQSYARALAFSCPPCDPACLAPPP